MQSKLWLEQVFLERMPCKFPQTCFPSWFVPAHKIWPPQLVKLEITGALNPQSLGEGLDFVKDVCLAKQLRSDSILIVFFNKGSLKTQSNYNILQLSNFCEILAITS
jgi:hypothetical protein